MKAPTSEKVLTFEAACAYLGCGPRVMRRLLRSAEIPGIIVGRRWKIHRAAVDSFVLRGGRPAATRQDVPDFDVTVLAAELERSATH